VGTGRSCSLGVGILADGALAATAATVATTAGYAGVGLGAVSTTISCIHSLDANCGVSIATTLAGGLGIAYGALAAKYPLLLTGNGLLGLLSVQLTAVVTDHAA
jgi:hypothetical protein